MVKPVTALKMTWVVLAVWSGSTPSAAIAEGLKDPTRPPTSIGVQGKSDVTLDGAASVPILQSVLISPGRVVAIISGQTVKLNDQFGSARVIKITETEVVLRDGSNLQTLKLFPNIEKKASNDKPDGKAGNRMQ